MAPKFSIGILTLLVVTAVSTQAAPPRRTLNSVEYAAVDIATASNCERLILNVQRATFTDVVETMITSYYLIDFCNAPPFGTLIAYGENVLIPDEHFTVDRRRGVARLQTSATDVFGVVGTIDLTWSRNPIANENFSGKGDREFLSGPGENDTTRQTYKEVRADRSASVTGLAFERTLTGFGGFGWRTLTYTEK